MHGGLSCFAAPPNYQQMSLRRQHWQKKGTLRDEQRHVAIFMDFLADKTGSVKKRKSQNKAKAADLEGCNRIEADDKHLLGVFFSPSNSIPFLWLFPAQQLSYVFSCVFPYRSSIVCFLVLLFSLKKKIIVLFTSLYKKKEKIFHLFDVLPYMPGAVHPASLSSTLWLCRLCCRGSCSHVARCGFVDCYGF